jgi:3-phosphoinositide dependent protein kinase-1
MPASADTLLAVEELKASGNEFFKQKLYAPAAASYSDALLLLLAPGDGAEAALRTSCLLNRAACRLKTGEFPGVVEDCGRVLAGDADNVKALFRRGQALVELQRLEEARADLLRAAKLAPKDQGIRQHYEGVKAALKSESGNFAKGFERMLEQGGAEVEEEQLESKGLGWKRLEAKIYEYPVASTQPDYKPKASEFTLGPCLGEGNFCRVHLGTHKHSGEEFAVKVMEKSKVEKLKKREHKNIMNEIFMERDVMKRMDHPNVGRLFYTYQDQYNLYFATELLPCGELWHKLMDNEFEGCQVGVALSQARFYTAEMVNALEYLRQSGIAHRDLKPENLMLTAHGHLKLIDFGTAKDLVDTKLNGPEFVGTAEYMAPEVFHNRGKVVDTRADLWSLGCIVYQLLSGETPFKTGSPYLTFKKARTTAPLQHCPTWWPVEIRDLISRLLAKDQATRIGAESFDELKAHPFFAGIDFESLSTSAPPPRTRQELALHAAATRCMEARSTDQPEAADGAADTAEANAGAKLETLSGGVEGVAEAELFHYLDRRKLFAGSHGVYSAATAMTAETDAVAAVADAPFSRARWRAFTGLSSASDFEFKATFHFVVICGALVSEGEEGDSVGEKLRRVVFEINSQSPKPKFLALLGNPVTAAVGDEARAAQVEICKSILRTVDPCIPLLFAGCGPEFGDDHYAFWFGGCCGLVLNDNMVSGGGAAAEAAGVVGGDGDADEHEWMREELCCMLPSGARHLLVFHGGGVESAASPQAVEAMRLAGVRAVFSPGDAAADNLSVEEVPRAREAPPKVRTTPACTDVDSASTSSQSDEGGGGEHSTSSDDESDDDPEDVGVLYGRNYPMQLVRPPLFCARSAGASSTDNRGVTVVKMLDDKMHTDYVTADKIPYLVNLPASTTE